MTSLLLYALFPRVKRKELTSFTIIIIQYTGKTMAAAKSSHLLLMETEKSLNYRVISQDKNSENGVLRELQCTDKYLFTPLA